MRAKHIISLYSFLADRPDTPSYNNVVQKFISKENMIKHGNGSNSALVED